MGQIGTRKRGSYIPVPKQLRVAVRYIAGETTREIAKNEQLSKNTVTKILRQPEIDRAMAVYRSELTELVPLALKGLKRRLNEANPELIKATLQGVRLFSTSTRVEHAKVDDVSERTDAELEHAVKFQRWPTPEELAYHEEIGEWPESSKPPAETPP